MAHKNVKRDLVIKLIIYVTTWLAIFSHQANAFCPHLCHCDDLRMIVTCPQESKLDVIPITLNPNLRELHLKENKIRTVDASFQFYGQLEYVDFSENEMSHLPQRCFASQKKLLKLKMDGNKIANITNATFVGLKSMTSISLRDNMLSSLQENLFVFLSKLEVLNLGGNQLAEIHNKAFTKLINLRELYLDNNILVSIPSDAFKPLTNLQQLFLGGPGNSIHTIEDDAFRYLYSLNYLDLGEVDLFNITENAFRGKIQHTIKVLNVSHNLLDNMSSLQLSQLVSLEELYVGANPGIEEISENCLPQLRRLKLIDLSHSSNLATIKNYAFKNNVNLRTIILDGNVALSSSNLEGRGIQQNALTIVPSPSMFSFLGDGSQKISLALRLRSMNLYSLNPNIIENWDTVNTIDLSDNPLNCDCKLLWLHDFLIEARDRKENIKDATSLQNSSTTVPFFLVPCSSPSTVENLQLDFVPRKYIESCDGGRSLSLPGITTPHDQLILILVCVLSAVFTGIIIFIVVHCRGRHCRYGDSDGSGIQRKCLPTSASSITTSTSTSYSADSLMRGARCQCCCRLSLKSFKRFFSKCYIPNVFRYCRTNSSTSSSSSPSSSYEITSCCTLRCCQNDRNILASGEPQFRSSIYDHSIGTNQYTFGRTSYYVTNPINSESNLQNFQQNVNMTLNYDRSTPSGNGGYPNMIHPLPLSLSAVEATLNHHLCQSRPNKNPHQTLMMPRSCSDDLNVESNTWGTKKYNNRDRKGGGCQNFDDLGNNKIYIHSGNPQTNSLYQDIDTCRYETQRRQNFDPSFHIKSSGNILVQSSDQPFVFGQETARIPPRNSSSINDVNPYAVPGEPPAIQPAINAFHSNREPCFHQQNGCKIHENNHYQNIKANNPRYGEVRNTYSSHSSVDNLNTRGDMDNDQDCDIWQKDTRDTHGDSARPNERYVRADTNERFCRLSGSQQLPHDGILVTTSSKEVKSCEGKQQFQQHKPKTSTNGEESCDSGDYFFSLSKDMKTMKTIPVSEL